MTIIVATGFADHWCESLQSWFTKAGMLRVASDSSGLTVNSLTSKMSKANKVSVAKSRKFRQVDPGKAWHIHAAEFFLTNAENELWGWMSPENLFFLEFWRDFDPECRFVLLYGSPSVTLSEKSLRIKDPDAIKTKLNRWQKYHQELFRFYHENRDRCVLLNVEQIANDIHGFKNLVESKFAVEINLVNEPPVKHQNRVLQAATELLLEKETVFQDFYQDMEAAADFPVGSIDSNAILAQGIVDEWAKSDKALQAALKSVEQLDARNANLIQENQAFQTELEQQKAAFQAQAEAIQKSTTDETKTWNLEAKIREVEATLAVSHSKLGALETENLSLKDRVQTFKVTEAELGDIKDEKALMLMQLDQLRAELKYYFNKHKASTGTSVQSRTKVENIAIDMRHFFQGTNWHDAEDFGRWAGPGRVSTIELKNLEPGDYALKIEIVDSISIQILRDLKLKFNGADLGYQTQILSHIGGFLAPVRRVKARLQNIEKPFPLKMTAQITKSMFTDDTNLSVLEILCPETISPQSADNPDDRALSICIKSVSCEKV